MLVTASALEELRQLKWCIWRAEERDKRSAAKVPYHPTAHKKLRTNEPYSWASYRDVAAYPNKGFLLTQSDDFTVIDLDDCINPDTGEISDSALEIVEAFNSYTELSPSGSGLHIIVKGDAENTKRDGLEVYSHSRYMTYTGQPFPGYDVPIREAGDTLTALFQSVEVPPTTPEPGDSNLEAPEVTLEDSELLRKARRNEKFRKLYDLKDISDYPSQSHADLALCGMLAFWTGCDAARMDRLFKGSALMRKKWYQTREDTIYGLHIIHLAISNNTNTYNPDYRGRAPKEVQDFLDDCVMLALVYPYGSGTTKSTDRAIYLALIDIARMFGKLDRYGVMVSASIRQIAETAGISHPTVIEGLTRVCGETDLVSVIRGGVGKSNRYLLKKVDSLLYQYGLSTPPVLISGKALSQTRRIRNSYHRLWEEQRLRKNRAWILELAIACGNQGISKDEISTITGIRKNNLKSRCLDDLTDRKMLIEQDGTYYISPNIEDLLEDHLEKSGSNEAAQKQKERHEREREGYEMLRSVRQEMKQQYGAHVVQVEPEKEETIYYEIEDFCPHMYLHGEGCYLCDPNHEPKSLTSTVRTA